MDEIECITCRSHVYIRIGYTQYNIGNNLIYTTRKRCDPETKQSKFCQETHSNLLFVAAIIQLGCNGFVDSCAIITEDSPQVYYHILTPKFPN